MGLWTNSIDRILRVFVEKTDSCWIWHGKKDYGYGRVGMKSKHHRAHRLIYEALKGPIPEGMALDHLCRNRSCVNPNHLEPVTAKENSIRSPLSNSHKTHCKKGHELAGDNLYTYSYGGAIWRGCKQCRRQAVIRNRRRVVAV